MTTHLLVALLIALGGAASAAGVATPTARPAHPNDGAALDSSTIHQEVDFTASPQRVYEALLDSKQFTAFSGPPATIDRRVGGEFSLFGGRILGVNVELVPNERIVQAWRPAMWPAGVYSLVRFELQPRGTGTHLVFDQTGFPAATREHLVTGWDTNYWAPLKKYFP
jgi:activator of HSP90 ATPase